MLDLAVTLININSVHGLDDEERPGRERDKIRTQIPFTLRKTHLKLRSKV